MKTRDYDLVLYGASGFVGRHAVEYLARTSSDSALRWAIAGRNKDRLESVRAHTGAKADVLIADSKNEASVDAVCRSARVVLNTAGPFALYGGTVVDACVRSRTHYVDISGETLWIREMIDRYHERASSDGTRIIPCCGFDSVPSDLGTYLVVRHMHRELGTPCRQVKAYFRMYGGFNGGTIASMFHNYESPGARSQNDPFLLDPSGEHPPAQINRNRDVEHAMYDIDMQTWVGPFIMGSINTRVVRRSAALFSQWQEGYGPDFLYQEYTKYEPPLAMLKANSVTAGMMLFRQAVQSATGRTALRQLLPKPGAGPSERTMETGWFICELIGVATDGRRVRATLRHQGDPGNRATARFACESALGIVFNEADLPGGAERGGLLTPATGLGDVLADRLRRSGMAIEIGA